MHRVHNMHLMATMTGPLQLRGGMFTNTQHRFLPMSKPNQSRRSVVYAGEPRIKKTFTDLGNKKFELNNTSWRKGGMKSEKVDGPVTRLWKFFFRPGDGYVDRYGFSVPMGPLDDRTEEQRQEVREEAARNLTNIDQNERNRRKGLGIIMLIALFGVAVWQFKTGASSGDRLRILPIFFLGSAEMASGLTGL